MKYSSVNTIESYLSQTQANQLTNWYSLINENKKQITSSGIHKSCLFIISLCPIIEDKEWMEDSYTLMENIKSLNNQTDHNSMKPLMKAHNKSGRREEL